MNRRTLITAAGIGPMLSGCLYSRYFDLEWDEEVQLPGGRVIVVHLKHTYERLTQGLTPYGGRIISRDSTLTFDAGNPAGTVSQLFKGFDPMFVGQHEGAWYAVLYGGYYGGSRNLPGQDWGELEGPYDQWAIKLVAGAWTPISMAELPASFERPNLMLLYGAPKEHSQFAGHRVTLLDKAEWLKKYPPGYSDIRLTRPTAASPKRPSSSNETTQGVRK